MICVYVCNCNQYTIRFGFSLKLVSSESFCMLPSRWLEDNDDIKLLVSNDGNGLERHLVFDLPDSACPGNCSFVLWSPGSHTLSHCLVTPVFP